MTMSPFVVDSCVHTARSFFSGLQRLELFRRADDDEEFSVEWNYLLEQKEHCRSRSSRLFTQHIFSLRFAARRRWWCFLIPNDQKSSHKFGKLTSDIIFVSNTKLRTPLHRQVGWAHWQRSPCHFLSPSPSSRCPLVVTRNTSKKTCIEITFFLSSLVKDYKIDFRCIFFSRALSSRKWKCTKFMWHCCGLNFENFVKSELLLVATSATKLQIALQSSSAVVERYYVRKPKAEVNSDRIEAQ